MNQNWQPKEMWKEEPCYIIGGGNSLEGFDWDALKEKNVIGCNVAFYIGVDIVPIIVFGDGLFLKQHRTGLDKYAKQGGWAITNSSLVTSMNPPDYLKHMKKENRGLIKDGLGWNSNTGASAINLALLFGCNPIYLLGYDMRLSDNGKKNYHNFYNDSPKVKSYDRFLRGLTQVARDLKLLFPGRQVINLEDNTSSLEVFPKESLKNHFSKERV
ncbi:MAG: hypothetical protein ACTSO3_01090 [Candidatus Heimdallarchaeaceae archaeon]